MFFCLILTGRESLKFVFGTRVKVQTLTRVSSSPISALDSLLKVKQNSPPVLDFHKQIGFCNNVSKNTLLVS